jgi:uncharacterized protein
MSASDHNAAAARAAGVHPALAPARTTRVSRFRCERTGAVASPRQPGPARLRLPSRVLLALIAGYQRTVSPLLPVVTLGGCACRFAPTCSHYAAEAVRVHGAVAGTWLAFRRVIKCTPLHPGGIDPVPPRRPRAAADQENGTSRDPDPTLPHPAQTA